METTAMVKAACDADRQPTFARVVMTLEDCIAEYAEYMTKTTAATVAKK